MFALTSKLLMLNSAAAADRPYSDVVRWIAEHGVYQFPLKELVKRRDLVTIGTE